MVIKDEIVAETKNDRIRRKLKRQEYDNGKEFFCVQHDEYDFTPIETSNESLYPIVGFLVYEKYRTEQDISKYPAEAEGTLKELIEAMQDFIDQILFYKKNR